MESERAWQADAGALQTFLQQTSASAGGAEDTAVATAGIEARICSRRHCWATTEVPVACVRWRRQRRIAW